MEQKIDLLLSKFETMETKFNTMEEKVNKIDSIEKDLKEFKQEVKQDINELKENQKEMKGQIDYLTKETFKTSVKLEDKIDRGIQGLDFKLDNIYINTVGIAKQFTDTTQQELPVLRSRQIEHSNQLEDHEERISKLEAIE